MKLIQDLREFIELLNSENVPYLVIGGWAYNRYAEPRMTGDIDFFVEKNPDTERRLRVVLAKFGFGPAIPPESRPLFERKMLMLGRPPNRIDLITEIDGITFQEAWSNRESGPLDGIPVSFISREDLIRNKQSTGREKDTLDAAVLRKQGAPKS